MNNCQTAFAQSNHSSAFWFAMSALGPEDRLQNVSMTGVDCGGREWAAGADGNRCNDLFQRR